MPSGAGRPCTALEDRFGAVGVTTLGQVQPPPCRGVRYQRHAMSAKPGGDGAVEGVDAELYARDEVVDVADPEQVSRALGSVAREFADGECHHLAHLLSVSAERATDGEPGTRCGRHRVRGLRAQIVVDTALDDSVDGLLGRP